MTTRRAWLPYVLPMAVYMGLLAFQSNANLLWMYPLKTLVVAGVLWWFRREYVTEGSSLRGADAPVKGAVTAAVLAVGIGLVAIVAWIALDPFYPKLSQLLYSLELMLSGWMNSPPPGQPGAPFDPTGIEPLMIQYGFIVFRVVGACLVVPVMEEFFWRGFVIRWVEREDFKSVPVGLFTWRSFVVTVVFFGLEHDQWLAGLICGALYNVLLYQTRSIWACVVAHAVSNAALAAWVLNRGDWKFW